MFIVTDTLVTVAPVGIPDIVKDVNTPVATPSGTATEIVPEDTFVLEVTGVADPVNATLSPKQMVLLDGVMVGTDGETETF
jgi:hypothetical protein